MKAIRRIVPPKIKRAVKVLIGMESGNATDPPEVLTMAAQDYWSRSAVEDIKRDLSHWKGSGRWADERSWRQIGEDHFALYRALLHLVDRQVPVRSMLEWGPGGGANAVRFGREIPRLYGVD